MDNISQETRGGRKAPTMRGAAAIQFASKYASATLQVAITAVLSRVLTPEEFGPVAVVSVFTAFFTMLSDTGIGVAVVQFDDLTEDDYGALLSFCGVFGVGLTAAFCLAGWPISWAYGDGSLVGLCAASSGALLFGTLNMVPNGLLLKEKRFAAIGVRLLVATAVSGAVAVAGALAGLGAYSLVLQPVVSAAVVFAWNLVARPVRGLTLHFSGPIRRVAGYSGFQFGFNVVNYFSRNLDNLLIGRALGTVQLAYYDKAYKLTTYPMSAFSGVIGSVVQPYMAEHQDDPGRVFGGWMRVQRVISLVAAPAAALLFCCADEVVLVLFGEQWGASGPLLRALAPSVYFQMMNNTSGAFFQSLGRTDLMFRCSLVNTAVTVSAIIAGIALGSSLAIAALVSAAYCAHIAAVVHYLVVRCFREGLGCLSAFAPDLAAAVASASLALAAGRLVGGATLLALASKVAVIALAYLVTEVALGRIKGVMPYPEDSEEMGFGAIADSDACARRSPFGGEAESKCHPKEA